MLNWNIRSNFEAKLSQNFDHIFNVYQDTINSPDVGFFHLPTNQILLKETVEVYESFKHKKHFIHVGIGGSALGPEMFIKALGSEDKTKFTFLNNIDPDEFYRQLSKVDLKESLIFIVSKSGTTAETVAAMSVLVNELTKAGIKENQYSDYFVFCTDPVKGDLRKISAEWNVKTLTIPSNIGGRFSVLTPVGFLPMLFAGINPQRVLKGAADIQSNLSNKNLGKDFYHLAFWLKDLHDTEFGKLF